MKILITAGSTKTMIDQVRCISNVFKGRTGFEISKYLTEKGHQVKLITSNTEIIPDHYWADVEKYRTYDELYDLMKEHISTGDYDVVIHSAAVSDYKPVATCVKVNGHLKEIDSSSKVGSEHSELYLKMIPTEKIIDKIRSEWGFKGTLVKFKLQVNMLDCELIDIAVDSMRHSEADIIVANCLEWSRERAYIIRDKAPAFNMENVQRNDLPKKLLEEIGEIIR
jgi:phosphopantothenate---cysteine ligase (CTP)